MRYYPINVLLCGSELSGGGVRDIVTATHSFGSGAHSFPLIFNNPSGHKLLEEGKDQHHRENALEKKQK